MREISLRTTFVTIGVVALATAFVMSGAAGAVASADRVLQGSGTADDPYVITNATELQSMNEDLDAHYVLGNDIDASETSSWNGGQSFDPIGDNDGQLSGSDAFTGVFDGRNHTIEGLTVRRPNSYARGLFGESNGTIRNVHLADVSIEGEYAGALLGQNLKDGVVRGASASGTVVGTGQNTGGLVGINEGEITLSWASVNASSEDTQTGGLVGQNNGEVTDSYATGDVEGTGVGGFAGTNSAAQWVYSTGEVTGLDSDFSERAGGLIGWNTVVSNAYWNVETSGQSSAAGEGSADGATGLTTDEMTGERSASTMEALVTRDAWTVTDQYPILQRNVRSVSLDLDRDVVVAGNRTNASVWLDLVGDRTRGATTVASYDAANSSVANISDGTITAKRPGQTTLTAAHAGNETSASILVIAAEGISAIGAQTSADEVTAGDTVEITGTFRNVDGNETFHDAELTANGEAVTTANVTVAGDSDGEYTFEWTPEESGTYNLSIDGIDAGTVEVTAPPTETASATGGNSPNGADGKQSTSSTDSKDSSSGGLLLPLAVVGGIMLISIGVLAGRRF